MTVSLPPPPPPYVLIVEHTYDGPVERAGVVVRWNYTGQYMYLEWADTTADGIFRNGLEEAKE